MKKFIAILMSMLLVLSMFTTVSASEAPEYVTFNLREAGANAILFGTETEFNDVAEALKATEANSNAVEEHLTNYITSCQNISSSIRPYKPMWMLMKTGFEEIRNDDGLIYSYTTEGAYKGEIPFDITTDVDKANGINLGAYHRSAQTLTLNSDKNLSALYVYTVTNNSPAIEVVVSYADGTSETSNVTATSPIYADKIVANSKTGVWAKGAYLRYEFKYSTGAFVESTSGNDGNKRFANIMEIPVKTGKKVSTVSFRLNNQWAQGAIVGITGQVASAAEITAATLADLKAKYTDASAVTISNYEEVKAILDSLNADYIPLDDADYVASLETAVNGFVASVDGTIAKYDYIEFEKNIGLAANVGEAATIRTWSKDATNYNYAMNIAAINNKAVKGYTFSDANIPFAIKPDSNRNYALKVSGTGEAGVNKTSTTTLEVPKAYKSLSVVCARDSGDSPGELYFTVTYSNGDTVKFTGATYNFESRVANSGASTLTGDQISYVGTAGDSNTAGNLMISANKYSVNNSYLNLYVPVYTFPLDVTKTVTSISVTSTRAYNCLTVLAMSAEKVTLADVIDNIEVTDKNYSEVEDLINSMEKGNLSSAQEQRFEIIKKQINFYVQDYVPFEISESVFNGKVFGNNVPKTDVTLEDYISVNNAVGNSSILDSVTWEAEKKNGLIYSVNNIPFNVRTDKGILFGNHSQASVEIDVPDGKYDSISALLAFSYVDSGAFEMKAYYDDGTSTVDSNWNPADFGHYNGNYVNTIASSGKESDSYVVISGGGTLRPTTANPDVYSTFTTRYYFPVMTLDTDVEKTLTKIVLTNNRNNVNGAILGVTGSKRDSTNKVLARVFNSTMLHFSDAELEAAHEAYVNSYDTGLYTNKTYGLEPMDVIYLKHSNNVLSGKVMSYVNTDNDYTVVALVLNADDSFARVEIMGVGTANLSDHDFGENIVLEEGQKIRVLLWEDFTTLKPYMTAKEL